MHNPNNQNNDNNVVFTSNTKFMLLQLRQRKVCRIHIQTMQEIGRFHTFHPSPILYISPRMLGSLTFLISLTPKICTWLAEQFRTFHSSLHESVMDNGFIQGWMKYTKFSSSHVQVFRIPSYMNPLPSRLEMNE